MIDLDEILDGQDFYNLMQIYRHMPIEEQTFTVIAFENVKEFIKKIKADKND